jgi:hypothetical protein
LRNRGGEKMNSKYLQDWEEYKRMCEKVGYPIQEREEIYMKPVLESYDMEIRDFIITLLL